MVVEHFVPIAYSPELADNYENLIYACRWCNRSRGLLPNTKNGSHLLDPTKEAWSEHFVLAEDKIVPIEGDGDAAYTAEAYDFNDPRKVALRKNRREQLTELIELINKGPQLLAGLTERLNSDPSLAEVVRALENVMQRAWSDLENFRAVPRDAPEACLCGMAGNLPSWFLEATLEVNHPRIG